MIEEYAKRISEVFENLKRTEVFDFQKYDLEGEPGAYRVAYSLIEIAESAEKIAAMVNDLRKLTTAEECEELVSSLKEELAHLVYHVKDSGLFSSIVDESA